jgi:hypothetical protein
MNARATTFRPTSGRHSQQPRRVEPGAVRRAWLDAVTDAGRLVERLAASDGEELLEPDGLRHASVWLQEASFPVPWASARSAAHAFLLQLRAVLGAGEARTRAVLAPALGASAQALDTLMNDQAVAAARASWGRQLPDEGQ